MQTRLTLRSRGGRTHDVEVNAPVGTSIGDVASMLRAATGLDSRSGALAFWSDSRPVRDCELLGAPGLRSGCVIGVDEPPPRGARPPGAIRLQVVGGPDAGRVEPVGRGRLRIGRDPDCELQLTDPDVSRYHVELCVTASGITVRDLDSTNGTRILSATNTVSAVATSEQNLPLDTYVTLGDTTLCVATINTPPASLTSGDDGRLLVNRPPRIEVPPPARIDLPPLPSSAKHGSVPWIAALVPALGGVGLAWFLHSPQFLAFALLSPIVLLATSLGDRVGSGGGNRRARASVRAQLTAATEVASALSSAEITFRRRSHPDPATILGTATTPDSRIWERRRTDEDFLDVRLGLGTLPARGRIRQGNKVLPAQLLNAVPAVLSLGAGPIGICGPRPLSLPLAQWIIGQLAVLHSPTDLRITALLGDDADVEWEWLRWLPHVRDDDVGVRRIARTVDHRQRLVAELSAHVEAVELSASHRAGTSPPWTVVLVDRCAGSEIGRLNGLLSRDRRAAITAVFLDDSARRLPPACAQTVRMTGETGSRVIVHPSSKPPYGEEPFGTPTSSCQPSATTAASSPATPIADQVTRQWCDRVARGLAPLHDPGAEHASSLPTDVRARDLFELDDLAPSTIHERWSRADGRAFTPVGIGPEGPLGIDLGRDGPHLLIAGTTGAGKSELLQTLVAGLAVHAGPRDVQFVLIDYKGGAAFGACSRLPHTAGLVTDLDVYLTGRALQSLDAELRRRETLFAAAGVAELAAYQRSSSTPDVLGRLVLVVDEFAALAEELPEFVSGLIGVAQRGRSLGVHLILATQRPGGVVSPEIRANTALRIALRVTDPAESSDVIGSDLAALIDQHLPGRAVLRSGQSLVQFQVGRVSVPVPVADDGPGLDVVALDRWGSRLHGSIVPAPDERTDLDAIVSALCAAADTDPGSRPRRPWLDPLPAMLNLASLPACATPTSVALGMTDRPAEQARTPFLLDFTQPRTMVFTGGPRSGRTSVLCVAGASAAHRLAVDDLHIYAIDCAGGSLQPLADLPHCGAVVSRHAPSSISALVSRLALEVDRRQAAASNRPAGTPTGPESSTPDAIATPTAEAVEPPALLILLDGWEGFLAAVDELDAGRAVDTFLHLLRDGTGSGLTVLITGDRATLTARLASAVQRRFVLRMSDPSDYAVAGLKRRQIPTSMPTGRMIDTEDATQTQLGMFDPATSTDGATQLERMVRQCQMRDALNPARRRPFSVRALPRHVRLAHLPPAAGTGQVVLGVGGDAGDPISVDLTSGRSAGLDVRFLVAGPPRSGRSTLLCLILGQLAGRSQDVVVAAGPRSPLAALATALAVPVIDPAGGTNQDRAIVDTLLDGGKPLCLLMDDSDLFTDSLAGERLSVLVHRSPPGLDVFVAGRTDDLALAFRGVAANVKRARVGLLLQPGPGDGELFGVRLPYLRSTMPAGRGLLVAAELLSAERWGEELGRGPIAVQVAQP